MTPDGVVQVVRLVRGWAAEVRQEARERPQSGAASECVVSTDLQNAFCNFYRHKALGVLRRHCPAVARMMAGHWSE
eukprot:4602432-Lingulodinium_polyedra.AAC.1